VTDRYRSQKRRPPSGEVTRAREPARAMSFQTALTDDASWKLEIMETPGMFQSASSPRRRPRPESLRIGVHHANAVAWGTV
jgi:hypothetical protein